MLQENILAVEGGLFWSAFISSLIVLLTLVSLGTIYEYRRRNMEKMKISKIKHLYCCRFLINWQLEISCRKALIVECV